MQETKSYFFIFIFFLISHLGIAQTESPGKYIKYSKERFTIEYPNTWRIDTSNRPRAELCLFSPKEDAADDFSENVNLIIRDLSAQSLDAQTTLDEFLKVSQSQIEHLAENLKDFSSKKIEVGKLKGYEVNFDFTIKTYKLHTTQYYFLEDGKSIVLTYSAEKDKSVEIQLTGENILNSFTYTKN